ncbi:MAG: DUF3089 domain-containing protein [Pseudomonadota bacterium]
MGRRLALAILILGGLVVLLYAARQPIIVTVAKWLIAPTVAFNEVDAPAAREYASLDAWAAHPRLDDPADPLPPGIVAEAVPLAAVFFVHPTTYIEKAGWNQPPGSAEADWITDNRVLRNQASAFSACCEVFAPRYRQATLWSFVDETGSGAQALDLAYSDVVRAFDAFLETIGPDRPFILASHSQGTLHATRLLRERIAGSAAMDALVAAYLVGFAIRPGDTGGVPVCSTATATACVVGWNSVDGDRPGMYPGMDDLLCVNPLSWTVEGHATHEDNPGGIGFPAWGPGPADEDLSLMTLEPAVADAECRSGRLIVSEVRSRSFPLRMPGNTSTHAHDYGLYWRSIQENASARAAAFYAQR